MTEKGGIREVNARRRGGKPWLGARLLASGLLVAMLTGCQNGGSTAKAPATQAQSGEATIQAAQVQPTGSSESVPTQTPAKPVEPVELKVTVLAPKIAVEKPVLDLGEVGTDSKRTGQFHFKSTGNTPLKILQVHSCCGVTTRGVENGQEFAPGASGVLEFDYLTGSTPQPETKRELRFQTNDPDQTIVTFTIKASVVQRVAHSPARLKLFLRRENAGSENITIRSLDGKPFSITSFRSTANAISADFDPNAAAAEFVLTPKVDMEKIKRNKRGTISVDLTHPECQNVRVAFDVLPEFSVDQAQLMVFSLRPGQAIRRDIWVYSNYQDDFEIESVSSQKGYMKLLDTKKVGNRYQLQLEITPPAREIDKNAAGSAAPAQEPQNTMVADVLEIKIKDAETISIPFRGFYAGS